MYYDDDDDLNSMNIEAVRALARPPSNNREAQAELGYRYYLIGNKTGDYTQAVKWSEEAAKRGSARGQFHLAVLLYEGKGVKKDDDQALDWFLMAAARGHVAAMYNLGILYMSGTQNRAPNYAVAVHWFTEATGYGSPPAEVQLAHCLDTGKGIRQNKAGAFALNIKAIYNEKGYLTESQYKQVLMSIDKLLREASAKAMPDKGLDVVFQDNTPILVRPYEQTTGTQDQLTPEARDQNGPRSIADEFVACAATLCHKPGVLNEERRQRAQETLYDLLQNAEWIRFSSDGLIMNIMFEDSSVASLKRPRQLPLEGQPASSVPG